MENLVAGVLLAILCAALTWHLVNQRQSRVPPGPPRLPVVGNLMYMPKESAYVTFNDWAKEYSTYAAPYVLGLILMTCIESDILSLNGLGYSVIILCSLEAVNDLLEKRSAIYSSRYAGTL